MFTLGERILEFHLQMVDVLACVGLYLDNAQHEVLERALGLLGTAFPERARFVFFFI